MDTTAIEPAATWVKRAGSDVLPVFKPLPNHQISIKKDEANDYERRRIWRAGYRAGDPWLAAVEHGDA